MLSARQTVLPILGTCPSVSHFALSDLVTPACLGDLCHSWGVIGSVQGKELPGKTNSDQYLLLLSINTGYFIP